MKKLFALFILLAVSLTNINIAFSISPDVFIQSTVNRASQILSKDISKDEKMSQLKVIAKETVDINGIGFYSLGAARKVLDQNQKKTYTDRFEKSSKTLKRAFTSPSLVLNIEENSSFCVLAKLKPSIIKSLINGLSGFLV